MKWAVTCADATPSVCLDRVTPATTYCTAMVAVLLVTVASADFTTSVTALPVGAFCGILMFT